MLPGLIDESINACQIIPGTYAPIASAIRIQHEEDNSVATWSKEKHRIRRRTLQDIHVQIVSNDNLSLYDNQ